MKEDIKYFLFSISICVIGISMYKQNLDQYYDSFETVCTEFKPILIMKDGERIKTDKVVCTQQVIVRK